MQKDIEELSASELRWLLIETIKHFVLCLGNSSSEVLIEMRQRSRLILSLLKEKESKEMAKTLWVNNSTKFVEKSQHPKNCYELN